MYVWFRGTDLGAVTGPTMPTAVSIAVKLPLMVKEAVSSGNHFCDMTLYIINSLLLYTCSLSINPLL